jgi:putative SOS response-associated peptidase YedK
MCYNVTLLTRKKLQKAHREGADTAIIAELEAQIEILRRIYPSRYKASGFEHPQIPVVRVKGQVEMIRWGLIPRWAKNMKEATGLMNRTLNARVEGILERPSFSRSAEEGRRCLVVIDGFFEHHHLSRQAYPVHIARKDGDIMMLAGVWDDWIDPSTGELFTTASIVTTRANDLMARIHNQHGSEGPRMPIILDDAGADLWMSDLNRKDLESAIGQLAIPFEEEPLTYWTVRPLSGQASVPDGPAAIEPVEYPELAFSEI